jgi:aspartate/methionine/tyrosine aminotransferase
VRSGAGSAHPPLFDLARNSGAPARAGGNYYQRRFGVKLNPETQVVATLGSKEGFANMAQAITAPGDVILCPNPTYPIHAFGFIMSGGVIRSLDVVPDDSFFARWNARSGIRSPNRWR